MPSLYVRVAGQVSQETSPVGGCRGGDTFHVLVSFFCSLFWQETTVRKAVMLPDRKSPLQRQMKRNEASKTVEEPGVRAAVTTTIHIKHDFAL